MSDLPSRRRQVWWENVADNLDETGHSEAADVIRAWWSGELETAAEWRETIDYEAAGEAICIARDPEQAHHPDRPYCKFSVFLARQAFAAAEEMAP